MVKVFILEGVCDHQKMNIIRIMLVESILGPVFQSSIKLILVSFNNCSLFTAKERVCHKIVGGSVRL